MSTEVATAYVDIKPDFSGFNREMASKMAPFAKNFGGRFGKALGPVMQQQAKHLNTLNTALKYTAAGGLAAAAYGFKDVVEAGMKFEKQMSSNAAVSEANRRQLAALERQSIKLGKATFYSASEAAEAQGELIKGGLKISQVLGGGLPAALALAESGQLDLATAAETTVNAMKLFGLQGKEAGMIADELSTAANKTTADVTDFAMALKQGGSVAKLAGLDFTETVTILESLAEAGIKNSDAGTSLKSFFVNIGTPSKKAKAMMDELGLSIFKQNGELKKLPALAANLQKAFGDVSKAEFLEKAGTIAGSDAIRTLYSLYEEGPAKLRALEQANLKQGTAQDIAAKKMDNLAGEVEQFKGSLETAEIQIYKGMAPALKELAGEATHAVNNIGSVFDDPRLSGSEKAEKAIGLLQDELGKIWDRHEMSQHLLDGLDFALDTAVPHMAEHAGELGVVAAKGFIHGFTHADLLGKVVMGTWLLHFIGGKAPFIAIGKSVGKQFGMTFAAEAAVGARSAGLATAATAPVTGSGALGVGWLGTETGKERTRLQQAGMRTVARQTAAEALAAQGGIFSTVERDLQSRWRGMGTRLARGAASWGLGGLMVGEISREVVGGSTGDELAAAFQGAGAGAAIGSAIAPGIGTALGAALGGAGGLLAKEFEGDHLGDQYAEDFLFAFEKKLPHLNKALARTDFGQPGRSVQKVVSAAGVDIAFPKREGASGLRGARAELREQLTLLRDNDAGTEALAALRQKLTLVNQAITQGTEAIDDYRHGFDLLRSGAVTRMGDISKVSQEDVAKINQVWKNNPPKWHQAMAQSMKASIAAIRSGMKQSVIDTDVGQKRIEGLMRNLRLFEGSDPLGIAKGFADGWAKAGQINSKAIQGEIRDLGKMPKGAREAAREAMVGMANKMESEGKLVKGSAARLNSALTTKFGQTNKQIQQSTAKAMAHIAGSVADGATDVGGALSNIFDNMANALAAVGASKVPEFSLSTLSTASQYHGARESTETGLRGWHGNSGTPQGRQTGGFIVPGTGSGDTFKTMVPAGSFVENREAVRHLPFQSGGAVPVILEPGERVHFPEAVKAIGANVLEARNRTAPRFQTGGLVHPKLDGPDPVRTIGQAAIDHSFTAAQKYLRRHLEPGRVLKMLRFAEREASKGYPYVYGGGHGSFSGPYDCSGFVSAILNAGGFLGSPMSVQQGSGLYTLGEGGPGKFFTWGVRGSSGMSAHTMMSIKAPGNKWKYFEAGGSGGGAHEDSGWDGSFQLRHIPGFQRGGKVPERAKEQIEKYGQMAFNPKSPHFVGWGYQQGGLVQKLQKGGGVKGIWGGSSIDKTYATSDGISTGETLPGYVIKALAEWAGLPGVTMFQITEGESTGHPGMDISDPPGRSRGLYAINDHYNGQFGATAMRNPILNTLAAKKIADEAGGPNANIWHGSSHVTGWNLHFDGDPVKVAKHVGGSGSAGSDEHSFKEDVPAVYKGAKTGSINFPSVPKNRHGLEGMIDRWRKEANLYRRAKKAADKADRPGIAQAIAHNITDIENFLRKLHDELHKVKLDAARKKFSARIKGKLGKVAGYEQVIEGLQRDFDKTNEHAEQIVELEPQSPELTQAKGESDSAFEKRRQEAEEKYVTRYSDYVNNQETGVYGELLNRAANWRNAILKAEMFGFGKEKPSVARMESTSEKKVYEVGQEIEQINAYTERAAADLADYKQKVETYKAHHKDSSKWPDWVKQTPDWLTNEIKERDKKRQKLPFLRTQDQELRQLVGELREKFFPDNHENNRINPPPIPLDGSGSLEETLVGVQGIHWPDLHELLPADALKPPRVAGKFGGAIWDVQTSIEELGLKITQAANSINGGPSPTDDNSELASLMGEIAERERKGRLVSETLASVAATYPPGYKDLPKYHEGGVVAGPRGREVPIMAQAGETVRSMAAEAALAESIREAPVGGGIGGGDVQVYLHGDLNTDRPDPVEIVMGSRKFRRAVQKVPGHRPTAGGPRR